MTVPDPRQESAAERDDRNLSELIQELRVVSLGVQVLFGFLLSLPFTTRFTRLGAAQRDLYLASLTLSAVATVLLLGPVAYHRLVFRQGLKEPLVRFSPTGWPFSAWLRGRRGRAHRRPARDQLRCWLAAGGDDHRADRLPAPMPVVRPAAGPAPGAPLIPVPDGRGPFPRLGRLSTGDSREH